MIDDVWVAFPSCNPERAERAAHQWREAGYLVAIWYEVGLPASRMLSDSAEILFSGQYPGYFTAVNALARMSYLAWLASRRDGSRFTLVAAADDMEPHPGTPPGLIAAECYELYGLRWVMQPTGDTLRGTDKICGSPWMSALWCATSYGGNGPFSPQYSQFYGDEELFRVAEAEGVLHQRPDLVQRHNHWSRTDVKIPKQVYQSRNSTLYWEGDKKTFLARQAAGFPR